MARAVAAPTPAPGPATAIGGGPSAPDVSTIGSADAPGEAPLIQRYAGLGKAAAGSFAPPAPPTPPAPRADPKFKKVTGDLKKAVKETKKHPPAKSEAKKAQDAAVPPSNDRDAQAKAAQSDKMAGARTSGFDKDAFVKAMLAALEKTKPKDLEEADELKSSGKADAMKGEVVGKVSEGKEKAEQDVEAKAKEPPDPSKAKEKPVTPLKPEPEQKPTTPPFAKAMPSKAPAEQTDLSGAKNETDAKLREADVSEADLKKSNEPEMMQAVDAKKQGEEHSAKAPQEVRKAEAATLKQVEAGADGKGKADLAAMVAKKKATAGHVAGAKSDTKAKDEARRAEVTGNVNKIFDRTKADTEKILTDLDAKVATTFDQGEAQAKAAFTNSHETAMRRWKNDRYGGFGGGALWLKDKVMGLPSEVNRFYETARGIYVQRMTALAHQLANLVDGELLRAKNRIQQGRDEIKKYVTSLPKDLQKVGAEAAKAVEEKFESLESDVDDKGASLQEELATKYTEAMDKVNADIEAMQAENKGLWDSIKDAIGGAIQAILKLKDLFMGILSKAAAAFKKIVSDPLTFIGNFMTAVKNGFLGFAERIGEHLKKGLQGWLFGKLGEAGIDIPDKLDLQGILKMVLSILGLTWSNIRRRLVKKIGEKAVSFLEGTVEVFQILVKEGIGGLWKWIAAKVGDLQQMVMGQIRNFVIEKIVKAGITWVLGMLNPAGALIKIIQALISVVQWIMEKGAALVELVSTVVDSVSDIANGGMGGVPAKIEGALSRAVPIVISFLASLLGLGGIGEKIKSILDAVQKPVMKAVDAVIDGALRGARALLRGVRTAGGRARDAVSGWVRRVIAAVTAEEKIDAKDEKHTLRAKGNEEGTGVVVTMASQEGPLTEKIAELMQKVAGAGPAEGTDVMRYLRSALKKEKELQASIDAFASARAAESQPMPEDLAKRTAKQRVDAALKSIGGDLEKFFNARQATSTRRLPADVDVRADLYLGRGSGWGAARSRVFARDFPKIFGLVRSVLGPYETKRDEIEAAKRRARSDDRRRELDVELRAARATAADDLTNKKNDEGSRLLDLDLVAEFRRTGSLSTGAIRQASYWNVDHRVPIAAHWQTIGYNAKSDSIRHAHATDDGNLELIAADDNQGSGSEYGGRRFRYTRDVGPDFASTITTPESAT